MKLRPAELRFSRQSRLWLFESFRRGGNLDLPVPTLTRNRRDTLPLLLCFTSGAIQRSWPDHTQALTSWLSDDITVPRPGLFFCRFANLVCFVGVEIRSGLLAAVPVCPLPQAGGRWWVTGGPVIRWLQWWR